MKVQVSRGYAYPFRSEVTFLVDDAVVLDYQLRNGVDQSVAEHILDPWGALCFLMQLCQHEIKCNSLDPAVTEVKVRVIDQPQLPGGQGDAGRGKAMADHDHCRLDFSRQPNRFRCLHCGAEQVVELPMPIDAVVQMSEGWLADHKGCSGPAAGEGKG